VCVMLMCSSHTSIHLTVIIIHGEEWILWRWKLTWVVFKDSVYTTQWTNCTLVIKNKPVNAVQRSNCCLFWDPQKTLKSLEYTLWQNVEFLNVKTGCPRSNHWDLTFKWPTFMYVRGLQRMARGALCHGPPAILKK